MNARREAALTRAVAAVLLVALAAATVFAAASLRSRTVVKSLPPLAHAPSDNEMPIRAQYSDTGEDVFGAILEGDSKYPLDRGFFDFCIKNDSLFPDGGFESSARRYLSSSHYRDEMWESLTGITLSVLYDIYTGKIDSPGVTVFGDPTDAHKTTLAVTGGPITQQIETALGDADIYLDASAPVETRYYISGGMKLAICSPDDVEAACANADCVVAVVDGADAAASAAAAGADIVFARGPLSAPEYIDGTPVIYGLGAPEDELSAAVTVSFAVGITPVVRLYPCAKGELLSGDAADTAIASLAAQSATAFIDDDNRIKEK